VQQVETLPLPGEVVEEVLLMMEVPQSRWIVSRSSSERETIHRKEWIDLNTPGS
jgi:hypothetical protein